MDHIIISIIILLFLIVLNGIFAMTEIGVVTSRRSRLEQLAKKGDKRARTALHLSKNSGDLLSTIQIGITLIGIIAGAFGGAAFADDLASYLNRVAYLRQWSTELSTVLVVGLTTFLTLVIGELAPKQIGLKYPEKVAITIAKPMYFFSKLGKPFILVLNYSTNAVLKMLGVQTTKEADVSEEEIQHMIKQGVHSGNIEQVEHEMVDQIFSMGDQRLSNILVPRTQLTWIDVESDFEVNMQIISNSDHSRFPVGKGSLDHFLGVIYTSRVFTKLLNRESFTMEDCIDQACVLPEHVKVFQALETLKASGYHEAVVLDEYGGVEGFVTLYDFMEVIVGDITTPGGSQENGKIVQYDKDSWLVDGQLSVDIFIRYFALEDDRFDNTAFHTLGGLITNELGDTPKQGDTIELERLRLEVVDMDHVLVDKLLVTVKELEEEKDEEEE
ncbi:hemolysin family protein [Pontibacillus salicampi]|uniref:Hemolysin family protein n=1 Tax=Pontibacillus salicampi TaxID=1449801 RepID=A0ABV6LUC7_9BACI